MSGRRIPRGWHWHRMTSMRGGSESYRHTRFKTRSRSTRYVDVTAENLSVTNEPVAIPTVANPTITIPTFTIPTVEIPTVANPTIAYPTVSIPTVANPTIANPTVAVPTVANPVVIPTDSNLRVRKPKERSLKLYHLLIKHNWCNKPYDITGKPVLRTKSQALDLIRGIHEKISSNNVTFAEAVAIYSECKSARNHGDIAAEFKYRRMQKSFDEVGMSITPGHVSHIVESKAGFHILYRRE